MESFRFQPYSWLGMENHKLVLPEHLNHFGDLFGGYMLMWVDEIAGIAASLDYPGYRFVTVGMDRVAFHQRAPEGAILRIATEQVHVGTTSVRYTVRVWWAHQPGENPGPVFSTTVAMVRVNERGEKTPLST